MSNTVVDFESAPIPASAIPTNNVSKQTKQDEKDLDIFNGERDITIAGADTLDNADEAEPTDEEYRTLKKCVHSPLLSVVFGLTADMTKGPCADEVGRRRHVLH